jgi:hypothetical protein
MWERSICKRSLIEHIFYELSRKNIEVNPVLNGFIRYNENGKDGFWFALHRFKGSGFRGSGFKVIRGFIKYPVALKRIGRIKDNPERRTLNL